MAQGFLAGVFLQNNKRDPYATWISAHGAVADITTIVALLSLITAFIWLKTRRDLLYGSGALFVAVLVETGLGHLINGSVGGTDHDALTILHIPLALAIMVLAMWLSARVAHRQPGTPVEPPKVNRVVVGAPEP